MMLLFVTYDIDETAYLDDRELVLSRPPGRLVADLRMGLRAPRDQIATMVAQAFVCLRAEMAGCAARQRRPIEAPARRGGPGMARFLQ